MTGVVTKGLFEGYSSVEQWVKHVATALTGTPGCYQAGGGPPPPRSTFETDGFWVRIDNTSWGYAWVPDEIAARDKTGKYKAGQESP